MEKIITKELLIQYEKHLREEEKAEATIQKYLRDINKLAAYAGDIPVAKEIMLDYKTYLKEQGYRRSLYFICFF